MRISLFGSKLLVGIFPIADLQMDLQQLLEYPKQEARIPAYKWVQGKRNKEEDDD